MKTEIHELRELVMEQKKLFDTQIDVLNKRTKELYMFSKRLEGIYYNGLSNVSNPASLTQTVDPLYQSYNGIFSFAKFI